MRDAGQESVTRTRRIGDKVRGALHLQDGISSWVCRKASGTSCEHDGGLSRSWHLVILWWPRIWGLDLEIRGFWRLCMQWPDVRRRCATDPPH